MLARQIGTESLGSPVHRILGWREFYGHRFALSPATLEPRPDTEVLVETAVAEAEAIMAEKGECLIADLGVGTGAIGLSVLAEVPGCGSCLRLAVVTYAPEAKTGVLDVSQDLIDRHGLTSEAVSLAMARGVLAMSGADLAVANTGVADDGAAGLDDDW